MRHPAARLVSDARARAGLSQRQLADRARTAQSVVARIEGGLASPTWSTLVRLLKAAGFDLHAELDLRPVARSHMLADVSRILALTPEARLVELHNVSRLISEARRA
jgi:transcriptional regulator with XRE-family HTH domain